MPSILNPYLSFNGNARQAMEFYKSVFGGKLTLSTFKEYQSSSGPDQDDKIMHGMLEAENGIVLMGADMMEETDAVPDSAISISLSGNNKEELTGYYNKLVAGGTVTQPLVEAPWGDTFGMCTDAYGTKWMVNIEGPKG